MSNRASPKFDAEVSIVKPVTAAKLNSVSGRSPTTAAKTADRLSTAFNPRALNIDGKSAIPVTPSLFCKEES